MSSDVLQSPGLCRLLLASSGGSPAGKGFKDIFDGGCVRIFKGGVPTHAREAETGTCIIVVTVDSDGDISPTTYPITLADGVTFEEPEVDVSTHNVTISKTTAETWTGLVAGSGDQTITYYRLITAAEAADGSGGGNSDVYPRIQGTIGLSGTAMIVGSTTVTAGNDFPINVWVNSLIPS